MSNLDLQKLAIPFESKEIEWRIAQQGKTKQGKIWAKVLAYINSRAVMDRLDDAVGPGNWKDRYWREGNAVMCGLSIRVDGEWVEKVDGSEETDIEAVKGGISGALKRAAVKWGIGRYLYSLTEGWAEISEKGGDDWYSAKSKEGDYYYWKPPVLPKWALPEGYVPKNKASQAAQDKSAVALDSIKAKVAQPQIAAPSAAPEQDYEPVVNEVLNKITDAEDMKELQAALSFFNAKISLGKENKPGGLVLPDHVKPGVIARVMEAKEHRKNQLTDFAAKRT